MRKIGKSNFILFIMIAAAMVLVSRPALCQDLVDAPEPRLAETPSGNALLARAKTESQHAFFDRQNLISFSAAAALRAADSAYTCAVGVGTTTHNADGSITIHREDMLATNSCHGVALLNTAFVGSGLAGGYMLHKLGWHKLERLPNWIVAAVPVFGIAYTATHQNLHAPARGN